MIDINRSRRFSIGQRRTYKGWSFRYPGNKEFKTLSRDSAQLYPNPGQIVAIYRPSEGVAIKLPLSLVGEWAFYAGGDPEPKSEPKSEPAELHIESVPS